MPLIPAKCTTCGGVLEVDSSHDATVCKYCDTPFITEKAINQYNTTNNITAAVVNVYGNAADFEIRAGRLTHYNGAATEVVIPNSVKIIGEGAFEGCVGLSVVSIPDGVTTIESMAFRGCGNLKSVELPKSVETIEGCAFMDCESLTAINLDCVLNLWISAFRNCLSLKYAKLSDSITRIKGPFFADCKHLVELILPRNLTVIKGLVNKRITGGYIKETHYDRYGILWGCNSIKQVVLPNTLTEIGPFAFYDSPSLESLYIPNSVTKIGKGAFDKCPSLSTINIPDSVQILGEHRYSFEGHSPFYDKEASDEYGYYSGGAFGNNGGRDSMVSNITMNPSRFNCFHMEIYSTPFFCSMAAHWKSQGKCTWCGGDKKLLGRCKACNRKT